MAAIQAYALSAFATSGPCLFGGEFVSSAFFVGGTATFARYLLLFLRIHRSETTVACIGMHFRSFFENG